VVVSSFFRRCGTSLSRKSDASAYLFALKLKATRPSPENTVLKHHLRALDLIRVQSVFIRG
jgi:hypothetical protein